MATRLRATMMGLLSLSIVAAATAPSAAADYPNRPVRWLIGFPAGGAVDIVARIVWASGWRSVLSSIQRQDSEVGGLPPVWRKAARLLRQ